MLEVSHYEQRLERDLAEIRRRIEDVVGRIEANLADALRAVLEHDRRLANLTMLADRPVNHSIRVLDRLCHELVVRHLPTASPLRFVSAVLRLNVALERVGDYAVAICRQTAQAEGPPPPAVAKDIELIGHQASSLFHLAATAFLENSAEQADTVRKTARQLEAIFEKAHEDLFSAARQEQQPLEDLFKWSSVLQSLKRVGNQADNICRLTLFAAAGKTKQRKKFRVLFVDRRNTCLSQMAAGYACRTFSQSGAFSSAGWEPGKAIDPAVFAFMDRQGVDLREAKPKLLRPTTEQDRHYHIIIGLEGSPRDHLDQVPFRTVLLEWDLGECARMLEGQPDETTLQDCYHKLGNEICRLMETLEGSDPDLDA